MFQARVMFEGERASLDAIYSTKTIACPKPIKVSFGKMYASVKENEASMYLNL